jgi:hypothetical protein
MDHPKGERTKSRCPSRDVESIVLDALKHLAKHEMMEGEDGPPIHQAE